MKLLKKLGQYLHSKPCHQAVEICCMITIEFAWAGPHHTVVFVSVELKVNFYFIVHQCRALTGYNVKQYHNQHRVQSQQTFDLQILTKKKKK